MRAWNKILFGILKTSRKIRSFFAGNGLGRIGTAMLSKVEVFIGNTEKIGRHVACRPFWNNKPEREVLILDS